MLLIHGFFFFFTLCTSQKFDVINSSVQRSVYNLSHDMRFPTMWYVPPAKPQISLRIRTVCSELEYSITVKLYYRTAFGVSKLKRRLHRLVSVYTCQNDTLLEITCRGTLSDVGMTIYSLIKIHKLFMLFGAIRKIHVRIQRRGQGVRTPPPPPRKQKLI